MKTSKLKILAEIAIFAALGFALDALQGGIFKGLFPNGGSIGFAMVPVFIIAYRRGLISGILCGFIISIIQMIGGIYIINSATYEGAMRVLAPLFQVGLDYVLAYTVVGFAGAFSGLYAKSKSMKMKLIYISLGVIIGGLLKYSCHVIAGILFWLPSDETWAYSFIYNGGYSLPNIGICLVIMIIIARFYPQFLTINKQTKDNKENEIKEVNNNEEVNNEVINHE